MVGITHQVPPSQIGTSLREIDALALIIQLTVALHERRVANGHHVTPSRNQYLLIHIGLEPVIIFDGLVVQMVVVMCPQILIAMPVVRAIALEINPVVQWLGPSVEVHAVGEATYLVRMQVRVCLVYPSLAELEARHVAAHARDSAREIAVDPIVTSFLRLMTLLAQAVFPTFHPIAFIACLIAIEPSKLLFHALPWVIVMIRIAMVRITIGIYIMAFIVESQGSFLQRRREHVPVAGQQERTFAVNAFVDARSGIGMAVGVVESDTHVCVFKV